MSTAVQDSRASWARLGITILAGCIGGAGMWTIIVALPMIGDTFGLERGGASAIFALTMTGFALGNVLAGRMLDRRGVMQTLMVSSLMVGFGHIATGFAPSAWLVGVSQFVVGLGTAGSFTPLLADISHWFLRRRGIAVSMAASSSYAAGVGWPLLLNMWIPQLGWGQAYALVGVIALIAMPPLAWALRHSLPAQARVTGAESAVQTLDSNPRLLVWLLCLAGVACCVAMSMPQVHIVALCIDLGFGPAVGAEMLSLMLTGGIVSRLAGGAISDRIGGLATVFLFGISQMLALFLYLPFDGLVSLYVVSLIFGLSQGGLVPAYAVIVRQYLPASQAGTLVGVVMMATILGMALGGWLSGAIYDLTGSYTAAFLNGIVWNLGNIAIIGWLLWRSGRLQFGPAGGKAAPSA